MSIASDLERHMLELINAERAAFGLDLLQLELNLNQSAEGHSQWVLETNTFTHEGAGGSTATQRIVDAGFDLTGNSGTAENLGIQTIASGSDLFAPVELIHASLMTSSSHRANILDPDLEYIGIGIEAGDFTFPPSTTFPSGVTLFSVVVTQNFGRTEGTVDLDVSTPVIQEGSAADDLLRGVDTDDFLAGAGGSDRLEGWSGNDILIGGTVNEAFDDTSGQVYRLYQATLARDPNLEGVVSWVAELNGGGSSLADIAAGFTDSVEFNTIYGSTSDTQFITLLFNNVLGRDPGAAGLDGWLALLDSGAYTRPEVVVGFSESAEFQQNLAADALGVSFEVLQAGLADDVFRLFQTTLDRTPGAAGLEAWTSSMINGTSYLEVVEGFVQSSEFQSNYGGLGNQEFVELLFQNVLGRAPEPAGLAAWLDLLDSGTFTRAQVVQGFAQSAEFQNDTAADFESFIVSLDHADELYGGAGDNILVGGLGKDTFVFTSIDQGVQTIVDLEAWDDLQFLGFGFTTSAEILGSMTQVGDDIVFENSGVTVQILDYQLSDFAGG